MCPAPTSAAKRGGVHAALRPVAAALRDGALRPEADASLARDAARRRALCGRVSGVIGA